MSVKKNGKTESERKSLCLILDFLINAIFLYIFLMVLALQYSSRGGTLSVTKNGQRESERKSLGLILDFLINASFINIFLMVLALQYSSMVILLVEQIVCGIASKIDWMENK